MYPPPRSVLVDYLTDIWAQFDRKLDPATVNGKTVYLKLDTTRLPAVVSYDSTAQRIHVHSTNPLTLLTTYTIEVSANVRAADGEPFTNGYLWQFTTQSVRHPTNPFPADGGEDSPFVTVNWGGNETTPGPLIYELYAGLDSAAVAARTAPLVYRGPATQVVPQVRWHEFGTNYWSITVENPAQGERYNGPVWRFRTPAASVPVDSVDIANGDFGYMSIIPQRTFCQTGEIITGPNYRSFQGWQLVNLPSPLRFARARWLLSSTVASQDSLAGGVNVYGAFTSPACGFRVSGNPNFVQPLAVGVPEADPRTMRLESDYLTAYLEASVRRGGFLGYFLVSGRVVHFVSAFGNEAAYKPNLRIWTYHITPAPARASSPAAAASGALPIAHRARTRLD